MKVKHIWFDVEETLQQRSDEFLALHDELRYQSYAKAIHQTISPEVIQEYKGLYKKFGSNSAVFRSLGLPADYWLKIFNSMDKERFYKPNEKIYGTLSLLHQKLPMSLFTNLTIVAIKNTLPLLKIKRGWFTHILTGDDVQERKPSLEGFQKIVELSKLPPNEILYVGDRVDVDIIPAKQVGLQTCLVWNKSKEADFSFDKFEDILSIIA